MAKKKVVEATQTKEDKSLEKESKRLRELACSRELLSEKKAVPAEPLRPKFGIVRCDGKDICKKGHRKNKYLFSFPGLVAPVAGGKFGDLTQLDSRNPILYVDFPLGRLKLFGTIVYPKHKYITMNFVRGAGNIQCEDLFESMVVFPEAWWIGSKEENPDELRLEMPVDLQQEKHAVYDFAGGAGEPRDSRKGVGVQPAQSELLQATQLEPSILSTPKSQLNMDQCLSQKKSSGKKTPSLTKKVKHKITSEWESDDDDDDDDDGDDDDDDDDDPGFVNLGDAPTPSRQSARTAGKKYSYAESSSEENGSDGSGGSDDSDDEHREPGGKTVSKLFVYKDADDGLLVPESQASKKDAADSLDGNLLTETAIPIDVIGDEDTNAVDDLAASQTSAPRNTAGGMILSASVQAGANASTTGAGSKQSSLSTLFMKSNEKEKAANVKLPVSVVEIGSTRTYQRKIRKSTLDKEDADKDDGNLTLKAEMESALLFTPPDTNGSKRKRKAPSEGKQIPKGAKGKSKPPSKRRKKTNEEKGIEETQPKEQLILVSDDSDVG